MKDKCSHGLSDPRWCHYCLGNRPSVKNTGSNRTPTFDVGGYDGVGSGYDRVGSGYDRNWRRRVRPQEPDVA